MFVCVHCGHPIDFIYKDFGDRNIRLTTCPSCGQIADKYVEFDKVNLLIETILLREQVYRHLIYNRKETYGSNSSITNSSLLRTLLVILCCDLYSKWRLFEAKDIALDSFSIDEIQKKNLWILVERVTLKILFANCVSESLHLRGGLGLLMSPTYMTNWVLPYVVVLVSCAAEQFTFLCTVCLGVWCVRRMSPTSCMAMTARVGYRELLSSVVLAQFGKVSTILMIIWDVTPGLKVLLDCYILAGCLMTLRIFLNHRSSASATFVLCLALAMKFAVQFFVSQFLYPPYPCSLAALLS
eukprot:Gregarina_sp_Poly_1__807@NODE_1192_length_4819_cov_79_115320_g819_i0_p1_GENE_NODE_1192_length_4819_cov_79_115320_g819_i0NODE_1192_length_4819_cov_79_115320_g819_i0_p1_ORF_typecomplete_len297_score23_46Arv1/PF04161_13/2_3e39Arv1/PF04161_13/3_3e03zfribbon_3/PF13248_6/4_2zfribbon_3/PF13248_6/0_39Znribbon_8/PF09723_10/0_021Znribbon_8/PF09723_10/3_9e03Nudix_N_2/PF14803_6/0_13zfISL3/PF14690_6/15zfISL3/PF14690_6/25zfISL3/PF14690_6/4_2e03zinc_ribbon_2/PF13240_6/7_4zinc_ribbon_2/PF13240_6/56zfTFIIB/PF134